MEEEIKLPYKTLSLCPECLKVLEAEVYEENGRVMIRKTCPEHGEFVDVYWGDVEMFKRASRFRHDGLGIWNPITKNDKGCPFSCGLCNLHKSHTALLNIVLTNRCDLACWYCLPGDERVYLKIDGHECVKAIRKLEDLAGDWVDVEVNGVSGEFSEVEGVKTLTLNGWTDVVKVFRRDYSGEIVVIETEGGRRVRVTPDHLIPTGFGRIKAENIEKGDLVLTLGNPLGFERVVRVSRRDYSGTVYDAEVRSEIHAFFAEGILVSNCFFYAKRAGYVYEPSLEQIVKMVRIAKNLKPVGCNAVQLTGGEPTLRDDLIDIIKAVKAEGIDHVQLNTNGIRMALDDDFALRVREAGVNTVYLSFDGVDETTNPKNIREIPKILQNCRRARLGIVLVPTVIRTVNDHQLGDIIRFAAENIDIIRGVNIQPVSLVGSMPRKERMRYRITIPDVIKRIEEQTDGEIAREDFYPVPCVTAISHFVEAITERPQYEFTCHFACGMATYVFKEDGRLIPITRFVDVEGFFEYLNEKAEEIKGSRIKSLRLLKSVIDLKKFIDTKRTPKSLDISKILFDVLVKHDYSTLGEFHSRTLFIGMMHFQDLYNYDIERVRRCVIHYGTPDGRIIPFCAFNVLPEIYRDKIHEEYGIPVEEWEKRTGKRLKDEIYRVVRRPKTH